MQPILTTIVFCCFATLGSVEHSKDSKDTKPKTCQELVDLLENHSQIGLDPESEKSIALKNLIHVEIPGKGKAILPYLFNKVLKPKKPETAYLAVLAICKIENFPNEDFHLFAEVLLNPVYEVGDFHHTKGREAFLEQFQFFIRYYREDPNEARKLLQEMAASDEKSDRVENDCKILAAALGQFYADTGFWPGQVEGRSDIKIVRLVSGPKVKMIGKLTTGLDYGYAGKKNDDWYDAGLSTLGNPAQIDTFDNYLARFTPLGNASLATPGVEENGHRFEWKGPYLKSVGLDPWGHPYVCNIDYAYEGSNRACIILSAGPNGVFDSKPNPTPSSRPEGDDIWTVVNLRY